MRARPVLTGFVMFLAILAGTIYTSYSTYQLQLRNAQREVNFMLNSIEERMRSQLDFSQMAAYSMTTVIDADGHIGNFDSIAPIILSKGDYLDAVQLVPEGIISHVYPLEGNEAVIGYDIIQDRKVNREAMETISKSSIFFAGPLELKQGVWVL